MTSYRQKAAVLALIAALSLPCLAQTAPKTRSKGIRAGVTRKAAKAPEPPPAPVVQEAPPAPPPPSRPYEMEPVPPTVTFTAGQLTISAPNSTLADILSAVRMRTGTKVDFPPSASQERVALQLGPGTPRDVLAQLLHGSPFDYILLGSDQDPNAVTEILLTRREGAAATATAGNRPNPAPNQPEPADDEADADANTAQPTMPVVAPRGAPPGVPAQPQPQEQPLAGPPMMQQVPEQNMPAAQPGPATLPGQDSPQQVKTPEQLLQELQKMQQQNQQRPQRPPR